MPKLFASDDDAKHVLPRCGDDEPTNHRPVASPESSDEAFDPEIEQLLRAAEDQTADADGPASLRRRKWLFIAILFAVPLIAAGVLWAAQRLPSVASARQSIGYMIPARRATVVSSETRRLPRTEAEAEAKVARNSGQAVGTGAVIAQSSIATDRSDAVSAGPPSSLTVWFAADSSEIAPDAESQLRSLADSLGQSDEFRVTVTGHAALFGTKTSCQELSERRAEAVRALLVELVGTKESSFTSWGRGADEPIADNATPEGMSLNRRVEIEITYGR